MSLPGRRVIAIGPREFPSDPSFDPHNLSRSVYIRLWLGGSRLGDSRDSSPWPRSFFAANVELSVNNQEASQDFPGEYRLDVEDFGPIAHASVDLRPLTVFIGPSNTGKSYLAILLYALYESFDERDMEPYGRFPVYPEGIAGSLEHPFLDPDDKETSIMLDGLRTWVLNNVTISAHSIRTGRMNHHAIPPLREAESQPPQLLPKEVDEYLRSSLQRAQGFARHADNEFSRCFSVDDMRLLARKSSKDSDAKLELSIPRSSSPDMFSCKFYLHEDYVNFSGQLLAINQSDVRLTIYLKPRKIR